MKSGLTGHRIGIKDLFFNNYGDQGVEICLTFEIGGQNIELKMRRAIDTCETLHLQRIPSKFNRGQQLQHCKIIYLVIS